MMPESEPRSNETATAQTEPTPFADVLTAYILSEEFEKYAPSTSAVYVGSLKRLIKFGELREAISTTDYMELLNDYTTNRAKISTFEQEVYAIAGAMTWAHTNGLASDEDFEKCKLWKEKINFLNKTESGKRNTVPLSREELGRLVFSTVDSLRDRALIYTILTARPTPDELRSITKDDLVTDENGRTSLTVGDNSKVLPQSIAATLVAYKNTLLGETFFPSYPDNANSGPMTRQTVDNIIKRHSKNANIRIVNHTILINTAISIQNEGSQQANSAQEHSQA